MMKRIATAVLLVAALLAAVAKFGGGWILERSQLARVVLWLDADPGDLHRFAVRTIPTGPETFRFHPGAEPETYGDVFEPLTLTGDGADRPVPLDEFLEERLTTSFLVVRRDTLIYERYFHGHADTTTVTTFSVSKSVLSMAVGLALDDGRIASVEDPVTRYVPDLRDRDPEFESVTIEHLLRMRSGLAWERGKTPWGDEASTYYSPDLRSVARSATPVRAPGGDFLYNNYNPLVVGLALEQATGQPLGDLVSERIWRLIGTEADASWSVDSRRNGFEKMESGFNARPRDLARLGRLVLRGGDWDGARVLSREWIDASVEPVAIEDSRLAYGYYWWVSVSEDAPTIRYAHGRFGQYIAVVPDAEMIVVRTGLDEADTNWLSLVRRLALRSMADGAGATAVNP